MRDGKTGDGVDKGAWGLIHEVNVTNSVRAQQLVQRRGKIDAFSVASRAVFSGLITCKDSAAVRRPRHGLTYPRSIFGVDEIHIQHETMPGAGRLPRDQCLRVVVCVYKKEASLSLRQTIETRRTFFNIGML